MLCTSRFRLLLVVIAALVLAGCGKAAPPGGHLGTITVAGSTSVQPLSEVLSQRFMELNPGVRINVQGGGSTAGVKAARERAADIGQSSRELKPEEKGLHETVIARDAIAIIVHPSNPVRELTSAQVQAIFAGRLASWKDVGGPDRAIVLVNREAGSGTLGAFVELVMGKDQLSDRAIVQNSTGAVRTTVSTTRDAVGYVSLAGLTPEVKAVAIDGVSPTIDNVLAGKYVVSRPFIYLTPQAPEGLVKAYIDFVLSAEGQAMVRKEGLVPVR